MAKKHTDNPLVSVVITTRNEEKNIGTCLQSITNQKYPSKEIIIVDNNSTDRTGEISRKFTKQVYNKGPERSAQRNFGAAKARGKYLLFLDADMELSENVVEECVAIIQTDTQIGGVIVPEESYGTTFWAKAKAFERSFYIGSDIIEAARFFPRSVFRKVGGFDLTLTGPEDWDLSQRIRQQYKIARVKSFIRHNEGDLHLMKTVQKKYYYAKKLAPYMKKQENRPYSSEQLSITGRYKLFFSKPGKLLKDPVLSAGMLFMKTVEMFAGGISILTHRLKENT